jgi:lysophospholipase L1-like esterase
MKQQIQYIFGLVFLFPLLPILYFVGKNIRKKVPPLPEAWINLEGEIPGEAKPIKILMLGESTIAGVGVTDHRDGLAGSIAKGLQQKTGKNTIWKVLAKNGYTAQKVHEMLFEKMPKTQFDFIFIGLGGNDTFRLHSPLSFRAHLRQLIEKLRLLQPTATIVILPLPPIADFPAFPKIVQFALGSLVDLHRKVIVAIPHHFSDVFYNNEKMTLKDWLKKTNKTGADFFSDGVHPSALAYGIWGNETIEYLAENHILK